MSSIHYSMPPDESASVLAVALLDELRISLLECWLVLEALPEEVTLKFDELSNELLVAYRSARLAHGAASLLHQEAELDEKWGHNHSRPKAVFARHNSAIRQGALPIVPVASAAAGTERTIWEAPALDRTQDFSGSRPICSTVLRTTGEACTTTAIYLGRGMFGAHCYRHATAGEREQYKAHHEAVAQRQEQSHAILQDLQRSTGREVAASWIQRREEPARWFTGVR